MAPRGVEHGFQEFESFGIRILRTETIHPDERRQRLHDPGLPRFGPIKIGGEPRLSFDRAFEGREQMIKCWRDAAASRSRELPGELPSAPTPVAVLETASSEPRNGEAIETTLATRSSPCF